MTWRNSQWISTDKPRYYIPKFESTLSLLAFAVQPKFCPRLPLLETISKCLFNHCLLQILDVEAGKTWSRVAS
jgi:hypothetical protein